MVNFSLVIDWLNGRPLETICTDEKYAKSAVDHILCHNVSSSDYYIIHQGRCVDSHDEVFEAAVYHAVPRIVGGKGGFGSMLRALGAQIEKTTNREACRDLSGRRMRDVNNEKKLREWAAKAADRKKEKEERRREKREKMLAPKKFREEDKEYEMQRQLIADDLDDAFEQGLKKAAISSASSSSSCSSSAACSSSTCLSSNSSATCSSSTFLSSKSSRKRKTAPSATEVDPKKAKPWLHMTDDAASSSDESQSGKQPTLTTDEEQTTGSDNSEVVSSETVPAPTEDAKSEETSTTVDTRIQDASVSALDYTQLGQSLDLGEYDSAEDLFSLGLDVLKAALMARGMKCGGTLKERAERLFAVKGLDDDKIPASLLAKPMKKK